MTLPKRNEIKADGTLTDPIKGLQMSRTFNSYARSPHAQRYEMAKDRWAKLAYILVEKGLIASRSDKIAMRDLVPIMTSAAIAYDKAFGKSESEGIHLHIPQSIQGSIVAALKVNGQKVKVTLKGQDQGQRQVLDITPKSVNDQDQNNV